LTFDAKTAIDYETPLKFLHSVLLHPSLWTCWPRDYLRMETMYVMLFLIHQLVTTGTDCMLCWQEALLLQRDCATRLSVQIMQL